MFPDLYPNCNANSYVQISLSKTVSGEIAVRCGQRGGAISGLDHSLLSPSGDTIPLLGYVLIGIGCFVVVSVVVILVATAALCRRRYIRKEMMNNFKVSGEEEGEVGGDEGGATSKEGVEMGCGHRHLWFMCTV